jgi:hypothetical protein
MFCIRFLHPPVTVYGIVLKSPRSPVLSLGSFTEATDETILCPGVDSASKNEYQDTSGVKAAGA